MTVKKDLPPSYDDNGSNGGNGGNDSHDEHGGRGHNPDGAEHDNHGRKIKSKPKLSDRFRAAVGFNLEKQLAKAILHEDPVRVKSLLVAGADPDAPGFEGLSALALALHRFRSYGSLGFSPGHADDRKMQEILTLLLDAGACPDATWPHREAPLTIAFEGKRYDDCLLLLQRGASPDFQDKDGVSFLHRLLERLQETSVKRKEQLVACLSLTLEAVPDFIVNMPHPKTGDMPLGVAFEKNAYPLFVLMLERGADPGRKGAGDKTVLHHILRRCDPHSVSPFLQAALDYGQKKPGFDVNVPDRRGDTPLHLAVANGAMAAAALLVQAGANIHARNRLGQSPLKIVQQQLRRASRLEQALLTGHASEDGGKIRLPVAKSGKIGLTKP